MANHFIGYQSGRGFLYQLSGASKLIFFILVSVACMTTYDTRLIAVVGLETNFVCYQVYWLFCAFKCFDGLCV